MSFTVGESVGPYVLIEQLGQGGMATVFKAYHATLDRYVALKVLHQAFTVEPNFLARFQREAQVVARLEHPNIVPIYDYAEHDGRPYLVMKFIEGETLKARLSYGPLTQIEIQRVVEAVGAALDHAHKQGVLHRDIKPSNVLLASDGRIYLADFGLARIAAAGESTISSDVMIGTPQYISPEQAVGQRDLDDGTDIYSFGILLYELLVGRVPYTADTPYAIIHDHIYSPLPLPRSIRPEISEAVELVLLRALSKERDDRFPDIATMLDAWKKASEIGVEPKLRPEVTPIGPSVAIPGRTAQPSTGVINESEVLQPLLPPPAPEIVAAVPESTGEVSAVEAPVTPAGLPAVTKQKPTRNWMILVGAVTAICICMVLLLVNSARVRRWFKGIGMNGTQTQQSVIVGLATKAPALPTLAQASPVYPTTDPQMFPTNMPPDRMVEVAKQRLQKDQKNPFLHFYLAYAYSQADEEQNYQDELDKAIQLAEDSRAFFIGAGEFALLRKEWALAASMYLYAVEYSQEPTPQYLTNNLHQALYLSASDPSLKNELEKLPHDKVDPSMLEIVRGRRVLLSGDLQGAQEIVQRMDEMDVELSELKLLQAEIFLKQGDKEAAIDIMEILEQDPATPLWIQAMADYMIKRTNP